jgi:hypothetical protein
MDKLLARIAEAGDEEDVVIRFIDATWSGTSLQLQLAVTIFDSAQETWEVRCEDVPAYVLRNESAYSIELTEDHPVLWEFKHESASAYFYRAPVNADAAVGALYEAHQNAVGSWIRFGAASEQPTRPRQVAGCGKRFVGSRSSAPSEFVQGDPASAWSGGRYSFLAPTADLGWNSLAAVGAGKQHESLAAGHFLRDWQ